MDKDYVLVSPEGKYEVISPITTLIEAFNELRPHESVEEIERYLKEKYSGEEVSLFADYIDQKQDILSKLAEFIVNLSAEIIKKIEQVIGITLSEKIRKEILLLTFRIVLDNLDSVIKQIHTLHRMMNLLSGNMKT